MTDVTFQTTALATLPDTTAISMNSGVNGVGVQRITIATDQTPVAVSAKTVTVASAPTLTVHATYAANDFVGTSATPWSWAGAVRAGVLTGTLQTVVLVDKTISSVAGELWLFSATVTPPNDSAAWTITDAEALTCIGVIDLSSYRASAANSVCTVSGIGLAFTLATTTLYGAFVTRGAPTYGASGDVQITVVIQQD